MTGYTLVGLFLFAEVVVFYLIVLFLLIVTRNKKYFQFLYSNNSAEKSKLETEPIRHHIYCMVPGEINNED